MTRLRRPLRAAALATLLAAGAGGLVWGQWRGRPAPDRTSAPAVDPARRMALLERLSHRLVPAADGGWVVAVAPVSEPAPESADRWLYAAVAADPDADGDAPLRTQEAFDAVVEELDEPSSAPRAARAIATVLSVPGHGLRVPEGLVDELVERSVAELPHDSAWLGPLLNLAAGSGPAAERAGQHLRAFSGGPGCDRLAQAGMRLPPPDNALVVLIAGLAAGGAHCPVAADLLDQVLVDEAWTAPIAVAELDDLIVLAGGVSEGQRSLLHERIAGWLEPEGPEVADLSILVSVRRVEALAAIDRRWPDDLVRRLVGMAATKGDNPDRSSSPTTPHDVAILRQLGAEGLVPRALVERAAVIVGRQLDQATEPQLAELLLGGPAPPCTAPAPVDPGRRSLDYVLASRVYETIRARCNGAIGVGAVLELADAARAEERPLHLWAALLALCRVEPEPLAAVDGVRVDLTGPFADDPTFLIGAAMAADPAAACEAEQSW